MKHIYCGILILLVLTIGSACGRRTAPVPYQVPDVGLPEIMFSDISYKGDHLVIQWQLESRDQETEAIRIESFSMLFTEQLSCSFCEKGGDWGVKFSISSEEPQGKWFSGSDEGIRFAFAENRYIAAIDKKVLKQKGLGKVFRIQLQYTTNKRLVSTERLSDIILETAEVPTPELKTIEAVESENQKETKLLIQWRLKQETLLQVVSTEGDVHEKTVFYGMNVYLYLDEKEAFYSKPLNNGVLRSGKVLLENRPGNLYACFVDRYGNESKRIQIYPKR